MFRFIIILEVIVLRIHLEPGKQIERKGGRKKWRKIKNKFNLNKSILYVNSNLFYLFLSII